MRYFERKAFNSVHSAMLEGREVFTDLENMMNRCKWVGNDPIYIEYHDKEWGVPVHDDKSYLNLLSWKEHKRA